MPAASDHSESDGQARARVEIDVFRRTERNNLYDGHRRIKFEVFVREQGWEGLEDPSGEAIAQEDALDGTGVFVVASSEVGSPLGTVRGVALSEGFPHRELFARHLASPVFNRVLARLMTASALAVLPPYRGRPFRTSTRGWTGSLGRLLMLALFEAFERDGCVGSILTAGGERSIALFRHLGCYMIDPPFQTPLHSELMANFGIVFGSPEHRRAERACRVKSAAGRAPEADGRALLAYFEACQALGSHPTEPSD